MQAGKQIKEIKAHAGGVLSLALHARRPARLLRRDRRAAHL
jgi:hypothetical protein